MNIKKLLSYFNLTRQEATIYISLTINGSMTGYEVAKETGISRSTVYTNLANLVEKGAAYLIEDKAKYYTPVAIDEFCANKIRKMKKVKLKLMDNMPKPQKESEGYITIQGKQNILDKIVNMLNRAKKRVYISLSNKLLKILYPHLNNIISKGLKVVIITEPPFDLNNAIIYYAPRTEYQLRLIVDSTKVLTGEIKDKNTSTCLYSKKQNLVNLFKESLKNEIKLIKLTERND